MRLSCAGQSDIQVLSAVSPQESMRLVAAGPLVAERWFRTDACGELATVCCGSRKSGPVSDLHDGDLGIERCPICGMRDLEPLNDIANVLGCPDCGVIQRD